MMAARSKDDVYELQRSVDPHAAEDGSTSNVRAGADQDVVDMHRLGLQQEFKRSFSWFSILGFTTVLMGTWQALITTSTFSLIDGGMAGTIWVFVIILACTFTVGASLAEMASMAPTSGGQYHWVSEFAPRKYQKFTSYITGWLSALGWQALTATTAYGSGVGVLFIASMNHPSYVPTQWHGTLATLAILAIATVGNTIGARKLPLLEGIILFLYLFGFCAILIPLWVLAPKAPASEVFGSWSNFGGWPSTGTAAMVGMLTATGALAGSDAGAHMAEEVRNASVVVPRIIMMTLLVNGVLGFVMIITLVFCITDIEAMVVDTVSLYPFIDIFFAGTGSKAAATVMSLIIEALNLCACLSALAAGSRQVFSFARDEGMLNPDWFRRIHTLGVPIPLNAIFFTLVIPVIFALLNLGSSAAFNSVVGLLTGSAGFSYSVSIGCVLLERIRGEPLPKSPFSLGRWGIPINAFACLFMLFQLVISFFPTTAHVTVDTMNWGVLVFSGVLIVSMVFYAMQGHKVYKGPVVHVSKY